MKKANVFFSLSAFLAVVLAFFGFGALEHPPPQQEAEQSHQNSPNGFAEAVITVEFNGLCASLFDYGGKALVYEENAAYALFQRPDDRQTAKHSAARPYLPEKDGQRATRRPRDGLQNDRGEPPTCAEADNSPYFGRTLIRADC